MRISLMVILGSLGLSACTTTEPEVVYQYIPRPPVVEPQVQEVRMHEVEWTILNENEMKKILRELETNPDPDFVLFALTPKGFEALSTNLVEINRFMREQNEVINYYRAYINRTNKPVEAQGDNKPT